MNTKTLLAALALGLLAGGCEDAGGPGAAAPVVDYHAQLWIIGLNYFADPGEQQAIFNVADDGTVTAKGAPVAKIVGQEILAPNGALLAHVNADDSVDSPRLPKGAHFDAQSRLVLPHARFGIANDVMVHRRAHERKADDFGQAQLAVEWEGGKTLLVIGHANHYERRATRELVLLGALFLVKPGALDAPPAESAGS